jgi:ribonucleoside-diphosphate reductase alpha chain
MAANVGPFAGYQENEQPMLSVMQMHRDAVEMIDPACPAYLREAARSVWDDCLASGRKHGYRNAQATVLAPTGTIAFMMDCDTTGIEPDIALVKYKQLAGGGMMKIVNRTVPAALTTLGYNDVQIAAIVDFIDKHDTIEGAPGLMAEHLPVFDCAFKAQNGKRTIAWKAHVGMMAAAQPFLSGAISKTVNMPEDSTVEDIENAYVEGWKLGLKALAIYRDGSKSSQPLATTRESDRKKKGDEPAAPALAALPPAVSAPFRRHLPATRHSLTHKFSVGGHEGYITVGLFEDGKPGELFITMAKEGSTIGGLMDTIGTLTSLSLQYGVPVEAMVNKFAHMRFEPSGWTGNPEIPNAKSVPDYIFRWLGMEFVPGYRDANAPKRNGTAENGHANGHGNGNNGGSASPGSMATKTAGMAEANGNWPQAPSAPPAESAERNPANQFEFAAGSADGPHVRSMQFAKFQTDAPACDNCGAITVRNGNCYLCHNCGNSMGCS